MAESITDQVNGLIKNLQDSIPEMQKVDGGNDAAAVRARKSLKAVFKRAKEIHDNIQKLRNS